MYPPVTATDAADDEGEEVQAVETKPAAMLLLVERGKTMSDWRRTRNKKTRTTAEPPTTNATASKRKKQKGPTLQQRQKKATRTKN